MNRKFALLIANSEYADDKLSQLKTPESDVGAFEVVLRDPKIGGYNVTTLVNQPRSEVGPKIEEFYKRRKKDDLLLLYFAGHGIKDDEGQLYLAVTDTKRDVLKMTGIKTADIAELMDKSQSRRQVLILDCCHSGAFSRGTRSSEVLGSRVGTAEVFSGTAEAFKGNGYGRFVLTATDAFQYAFDGDTVVGEGGGSAYTRHLIHGLRTGAADLDGDDKITVDEMADYVYRRVVEETPTQTPEKWSSKQQGDIVIALSARRFESPKAKERCFIISPLSTERADIVFNSYIEPACRMAGLEPIRAHMELSQQIMPQVIQSLRTDPVAVAYLGEPPWNANVMVEVGYRLATGQPIVLLRDKPTSHDESPLPFDLHDHRVIFLPDSKQETKEQHVKEYTIKIIAETITARIQSSSIWEAPHPMATIRFNTDTGAGVYYETSPAAENVFNMEGGLKGKTLKDVIETLKTRMPTRHFEQFVREQTRIIQQLGTPVNFADSMEVPHANKPVVFLEHGPNRQPVVTAFLPIIIQYSKQGNELWLKVLYVDVTSVTKKVNPEEEDPDKLAFVCALGGDNMSTPLSM